MHYQTIVVGGGIAGLTCAAFTSKSGLSTLLVEKEPHFGGLVNSFSRNGFIFDGGLRATENSGILRPMLNQLGLDVPFAPNPVSVGTETNVVKLGASNSLTLYRDFLVEQFPEEKNAIEKIIAVMKQMMGYMDVLYGIDNPLFLDLKADREYLMKTVMPWMVKYLMTIGKIKRYSTPVEDYLKTITSNQALIDMIAQHFFRETPSFFALSYFSVYLDYQYPLGGTGKLVDIMSEFIQKQGGMLKPATVIDYIDAENKTIRSESGEYYTYDALVWTADKNAMYKALDIEKIKNKKVRNSAIKERDISADKLGGDSVMTLYLSVNQDKTYFEKIHTPHFFYTPVMDGLHQIPLSDIKLANGTFIKDKEALIQWLRTYLTLTTFEIACPVMRDDTLAPAGKTGLIISTLFDYHLVKHIEEMGWYDEFKRICQDKIIDVLTDSIYPKIKKKIIDGFIATPLTLARLTGNTHGAITGWAFTNDYIPAITDFPKVAQAIKTPIPDILQAGQWTYSPSGFPISILTGKLAADRAIKNINS